METDRHTREVRNAAAHSYQPAKYLRDQDDSFATDGAAVVADFSFAIESYEPLPPHIQE